MQREIDVATEKGNFIPDGRLEEYLEGKNLVRPDTSNYEDSEAAKEAYKAGRANVSRNLKRKAEGAKR